MHCAHLITGSDLVVLPSGRALSGHISTSGTRLSQLLVLRASTTVECASVYGAVGARTGSHAGIRTTSRTRARTIAGVARTMTIDGLNVTITRKRIKNLYLRIKPPSGNIEISAPARMPEAQIVAFVRERRQWITQQQYRIAEARQLAIDTLLENTGRLSGGTDEGVNNTTNIERISDVERVNDEEKSGIIQQNQADSHGNIGNDDEGNDHGVAPTLPYFDRATIWTDDRKKQAAQVINAALPELLSKWGAIIGRKPTHITLRIMTSRWGSCTPKTGRIRLNLQLGLMEPKFLEYVLVHEMTHLWASGHGVEFQRRMTAYLPQWRQLRRELNARVVW